MSTLKLLKTGYIILKSGFNGSIQTTVSHLNNDTSMMDYSNGKTLTEYLELNPLYKEVSEKEIDELLLNYEKSLIKKPEKISKKEYWDALECLPPVRWTHGTIQYFFISEANYGNNHNFFFIKENKYYAGSNNIYATHDELIKYAQTA